LENQKRLTVTTNQNVPVIDLSTLVDIQRIFRRVMTHYQSTLSGDNPPPLRLNIDGTAGTGKSYLIWAMARGLNEMAQQFGKSSPVLHVAPTGIATFNIQDSTLHQMFNISKVGLDELKSEPLIQLQNRLGGCQYIILDEKSMVGRGMLGKVNARLRQAFQEHKREMFGGRSILLFGDFGQLTPIGDTPLYDLEVKVQGAKSGRDCVQKPGIAGVFVDNRKYNPQSDYATTG